jgi:hypothetical protein
VNSWLYVQWKIKKIIKKEGEGSKVEKAKVLIELETQKHILSIIKEAKILI